MAGAERGEFQRRDVSTEFQSKKRREARDRGTRPPRGEIAQDLTWARENVSVSPPQPFSSLSPNCSFSLLISTSLVSRSRNRDFRDRSRSKSIEALDCVVRIEEGEGRGVGEVREWGEGNKITIARHLSRE